MMRFILIILSAATFVCESAFANGPLDLEVSVLGGSASVTVVQVSDLRDCNRGVVEVLGGGQNQTVYAAPGQKVSIQLLGGKTGAYIDRRFSDDVQRGNFIVWAGGGGSTYKFF